MASRSEMNKKPQAENLQPKVRKCLMCSSSFQSSHIGERVCPDCKSTSTWRQTGIAIQPYLNMSSYNQIRLIVTSVHFPNTPVKPPRNIGHVSGGKIS